jgi:hypothetical protein
MTLIEMLVAMAATLMLMAAVAQAFSIFGKGISGSRSALDTAGRMRSVAWRLRQDLAGATAPTVPPLDPADGLGYFEIIEGPRADFDPSRAMNDLVADIDDMLMFTTRASGEPFRGKFETGTLESDVAEVAWFARPTVPATVPPTYTLYRKQLLVSGYVGAGEFERFGQNRIPAQPLPQFYETYDLSVSRRKDSSTDAIVPNSLADLTRREFRFLHNPSGDMEGNTFPYWFLGAAYGNATAHLLSSTSPVGDQLPPALAGLIFDSSSIRRGEDVLLTNVIGFDVRVFDPSAPLQPASSGTEVVTPGDQVPVTTAAAFGGYVDLGNPSLLPGPAGLPRPVFSGPPNTRSGLNSGLVATYDTWSLGYEADGIDQDKDGVVDQGTDGFDSQPSLDGVVDDAAERETSAPYSYPLRGIEVRIRCYEPSSRQVRQVTVRHTFVPH